MSCWVVPAVAAEMWGKTIAQVLEQVRCGELTSKTEYGFMLVDVAPQSPRYDSLNKRMHRPATFVEVPAVPAVSANWPPASVKSLLDEEVEADEDQALPWRTTRQAVSQTRRPPGMAGRDAPLSAAA